MKHLFATLLILAMFTPFPVSLIAQQRDPNIGYLYPSGGRQDTTFQVLVGGRQIARSRDVIISGQGVRGRVVRSIPSMRVNDSDERRLINQIYLQARQELEGGSNLSSVLEQKEEQRNGNQESGTSELSTLEKKLTANDVVKKYPYLDRLSNPSTRDIELVYDFYFSPRPERKPVEALGQGVMLEITIDPHAEPGDRDLRLMGPNGLTPPVRFMVGTIPEIMEREPNDPTTHSGTKLEIWNRQVTDAPKSLWEQHVYDIPVVLNGQIRAGDIDRFQFRATQGQKIVFDVRARHLIPYLADGVPGWFQAALSLFDVNGKKIDEAMSYRHDPDPVLCVEIPKDGVYSLEIQDSIFRGRDDFVYRITIGELPLLTSMFPLGTQQGTMSRANIDGWNLPEKIAPLEGKAKMSGIYEITSLKGKQLLRPIRFAVDDLPEYNEKEPNNSVNESETVELPMIVNGRILDENDIDCFAFEAQKGQHVIIDVSARTLDSPLDAKVELLDPQGNVIAANDDRADCTGPNIGLETHHADPYLNVILSSGGRHIVRLYDVTQRGGKEYGYRLRISPPRPDFAIFCEPSSLTIRKNRQPLKIHIVRKDGFSREVKLRPAKGSFLQIENGLIAANANETTIDMVIPTGFGGKPTNISLEAVSMTDEKEIVRPVIAVKDMEQAFIYHHWVPAKSLMLYEGRNWRNRE